jgi:RHS repeat-associated protein
VWLLVRLYYYRHRYYDPAAGRFVSRDPLGLWGDSAQAGNGQSYCGGNPVNRVDPWGRDEGYTDRWSPPDVDAGSTFIGSDYDVIRPGLLDRPPSDPPTPENQQKWATQRTDTRYAKKKTSDGKEARGAVEWSLMQTESGDSVETVYQGSEGHEHAVRRIERHFAGPPAWKNGGVDPDLQVQDEFIPAPTGDGWQIVSHKEVRRGQGTRRTSVEEYDHDGRVTHSNVKTERWNPAMNDWENVSEDDVRSVFDPEGQEIGRHAVKRRWDAKKAVWIVLGRR